MSTSIGLIVRGSHDQVAQEIRRALAEGEAKPGERLPPAHHLAAVMGVNTNTALRGRRTLLDEGLLEMRPHRGIRRLEPRQKASCVATSQR
jgi:DNA-binding transcriptional regulator YhcF (GntR family)